MYHVLKLYYYIILYLYYTILYYSVTCDLSEKLLTYCAIFNQFVDVPLC